MQSKRIPGSGKKDDVEELSIFSAFHLRAVGCKYSSMREKHTLELLFSQKKVRKEETSAPAQKRTFFQRLSDLYVLLLQDDGARRQE